MLAPDALHASGLLWPEAAQPIGGTAYAAREGVGAGQAILFAADPVFRGFTLATKRLFMNAIHLGPGLGRGKRNPRLRHIDGCRDCWTLTT